MPGPTPPLFTAMADALGEHVGPRAASFVHVVFSLYDERELRELMHEAGFREVDVRRTPTTLTLPAGDEFLWQYLSSTPLAGLVGDVTDEGRAALAADVGDRWHAYTDDGTLRCDVTVSTVTGR